MSDEIKMSIGELSRWMGRFDRSQITQTAMLNEIKDQTIKTNGRVNLLEREVAEIKQRNERERAFHQNESKRSSDRSDVITLNIPASAISPKALAGLLVAMIVGMFAAWKAGLL